MAEGFFQGFLGVATRSEVEDGEDVAMHHHDELDERGVFRQGLATLGHAAHQHPHITQLLVGLLQLVGVFQKWE